MKINYKDAYDTLLIAYNAIFNENKRLKSNRISMNDIRKMYNLPPIGNNQKKEFLDKLEKDKFTCVSNLEVSGLSANSFEYGLESEIEDIVDKINDIIDYLKGV